MSERKLYDELERRLRGMGILNLYVCIAYTQKDDEYLDKNSAQLSDIEEEANGHVTYDRKFVKTGVK